MNRELSPGEQFFIEERAEWLATFKKHYALAMEAEMEYHRKDEVVALSTGMPKEDAIAAIKTGKKAKATQSGKAFAKKEDVLRVMTVIAEENPGIDSENLEKLTKHKLSKSGFSLSGVPNQLKKYLASDVFSIEADGGVSLAPNGGAVRPAEVGRAD